MPRHYITNKSASLKLSHCTRAAAAGGRHFKEAVSKVMFLQHSRLPFSPSPSSTPIHLKMCFQRQRDAAMQDKAGVQVSQGCLPTPCFQPPQLHMAQRAELRTPQHPYKCTSPQDSAGAGGFARVSFGYTYGVHRPETMLMKIKVLC